MCSPKSARLRGLFVILFFLVNFISCMAFVTIGGTSSDSVSPRIFYGSVVVLVISAFFVLVLGISYCKEPGRQSGDDIQYVDTFIEHKRTIDGWQSRWKEVRETGLERRNKFNCCMMILAVIFTIGSISYLAQHLNSHRGPCAVYQTESDKCESSYPTVYTCFAPCLWDYSSSKCTLSCNRYPANLCNCAPTLLCNYCGPVNSTGL